MMEWSLSTLLSSLHDEIQQRLSRVRRSFEHPGTMGDASENVWMSLLKTYLPKRYQAAKAHVVDSLGNFSQQIDVVIFDRQYSPFISPTRTRPSSRPSIYAAFEAKQTVDAQLVGYAQEKIASVRRLHRTSLPIPYAEGIYPAKPLIPILGGILAFESKWKPALGPSFKKALQVDMTIGRLDIGCIASHGHFLFRQCEIGTRLQKGHSLSGRRTAPQKCPFGRRNATAPQILMLPIWTDVPQRSGC